MHWWCDRFFLFYLFAVPPPSRRLVSFNERAFPFQLRTQEHNMRPIQFLFLACCFIASCRSADEEYEYEDEPVPVPVTPAPTKPASRLGSLLSNRARPSVGRKSTPTSSTTPKLVEPTVDEGEDGEELVDENGEQEETLTTTTESSKKLRTAGGVRPFRSNEDLLAALKRRRAQVGSFTKEHTTHSPAEPTSPKSKPSATRNKSTLNDSVSRPSTRGRFGSSSRGKVQEEVEETQQEEVQVKAKPFRRG